MVAAAPHSHLARSGAAAGFQRRLASRPVTVSPVLIRVCATFVKSNGCTPPGTGVNLKSSRVNSSIPSPISTGLEDEGQPAAQLDRAGQVFAWREDDLAGPGNGGGLHCAADGGRVECFAISHRSVVANVAG